MAKKNIPKGKVSCEASAWRGWHWETDACRGWLVFCVGAGRRTQTGSQRNMREAERIVLITLSPLFLSAAGFCWERRASQGRRTLGGDTWGSWVTQCFSSDRHAGELPGTLPLKHPNNKVTAAVALHHHTLPSVHILSVQTDRFHLIWRLLELLLSTQNKCMTVAVVTQRRSLESMHEEKGRKKGTNPPRATKVCTT